MASRDKPTRKLNAKQLQEAQDERRLADAEKRALERLRRSRRFKAKVAKLTSMGTKTVTMADLDDTPDPDDEGFVNKLLPVVT